MTSYNVAHVEKAVLFDDSDLNPLASVNEGLAPFPAAAAGLPGTPVPPTEGAMALKSALEGERVVDMAGLPDVVAAAEGGGGAAAQHSGSGSTGATEDDDGSEVGRGAGSDKSGDEESRGGSEGD